MEKPKKKPSLIRWWFFYTIIGLAVLSLGMTFGSCAVHNWFAMVGWGMSTLGFSLYSLHCYANIQENKGYLW